MHPQPTKPIAASPRWFSVLQAKRRFEARWADLPESVRVAIITSLIGMWAWMALVVLSA